MGTELLTDTFCRLQEKLHLVAGRLLEDESDAEDAVQDTFCNLWSDRMPDSSDEARFRLFAVLKNVCLNKIRRRPSTDIESVKIVIEPRWEIDPERMKKEFLLRLTPLQREVFSLSVFEEMEYAEIAEKLGMNIEAVRMNMSRARKTLRELYNKMKL